MAFSFIRQAASAGVTATTNNRTLTGVAAGSTLVVMAANRTDTTQPTGISDTVNGAWNLANSRLRTGNGGSVGIYYFPNSGAGNPVITVTYAGSVNNIMAAQEFGASSNPAVTTETSNGNTNSSTTSHSHGSVTTAGASLLLTAAIEFGTLTETANATFTALTDSGLRLYMQYKLSSGETTTGVFTTAETSTTEAIILALIEPAGGPSITNVDTDNTVTLSQANFTTTGTDFDTATAEIRQGAFTHAVGIDSQNTTTIVSDMPDNTLAVAPKHGAATFAVINDDDSEDTQAITIAVDSGSAYVDVGTPNADEELRLESTADVVSGDQVEYGNVQGGTIADVTVNTDLTWEAEEAVTAFDFRVWDQADSSWGAWATQTINGSEPDQPGDGPIAITFRRRGRR